MKKNRLFRILNGAPSDDVIRLGRSLQEKHEVSTLKKPDKTLVMLKLREGARNSLFYAGEALGCECMVRLGEHKGFAAALGDDMDKTYAMAVIDAALNAAVPEREDILAALGGWEASANEKRARDAALVESTRLDFSTREEQNG